MGRIIDKKEYCHERLGEQFTEALSNYDTQRRVETLIDEFLSDAMIVGRRVLDAGCGLGHFSQRLKERGAEVVACDIGSGLVEKTHSRVGCVAKVADVLELENHFTKNSFDVVVSSECIEHTPKPLKAIQQMIAVVKPGGYLSLSTPNLLWYPVVRTATLLRLRPFDGYENFSTRQSIHRTLAANNMQVIHSKGLHLFPFQFGLHSLSYWCDKRLQWCKSLMINICVLAQKQCS